MKGKPTIPITPITLDGKLVSPAYRDFFDRLVGFISTLTLIGTFADRPAADTVYPGTLYFATDTGITYISDGVSWFVYSGTGTLVVDPAGALDGNGTSLSPLAVKVDGVTVSIVGDELTATGSGGDVVGPASATDNAIARYNGTTGKLIQNSAPIVQDDGRISTVTDPSSAQDAATKAYVDAQIISGGGNDISSTAVGSEPGSPTSGDTDLYTNALSMARYSGSAWVPWGPIWALSNPVTNGPTTWVNQGGASIASTNGVLYLLGTANAGPALRLYVKAQPSTPYVITARVIVLMTSDNFAEAGLCWRDSASGKIVTFSITQASALGAAKWTDPTTFSASYTGTGAYLVQASSLWLRIADDGANRIMTVSMDGYNFQPVHSVGNTDFLTADQVGIFVKEQNATYTPSMTLVSWKQT